MISRGMDNEAICNATDLTATEVDAIRKKFGTT